MGKRQALPLIGNDHKGAGVLSLSRVYFVSKKLQAFVLSNV